MDTKIVDGEVYYWIYHKKVSEDMPILHLQKTAIYRRLKKLCKAQIFKKTVVRERGTFTYYAIGPNYIRLISNTPNSSIASTYDSLSSEDKSNALHSMWRNKCVSDLYEPGSVFKLITASVALEEHITTPDVEGDFVCNGYEQKN